MKVNRLFLSLTVIGGFLAAGFTFGGISYVNASLQTSLGAVLSSFILSVTAIFFPRKKRPNVDNRPVGLTSRFFAFYIDFAISLALFMSFYAPIVASLEYLATGTWQWSYVRNDWATRDLVGLALTFLGFIWVFYYFYVHFKKGLETPGQYILGFKIIPASSDTKPKYGERIGCGIIAIWANIFTVIFSLRVKDGIYWWDRRSNTRAIRTRP